MRSGRSLVATLVVATVAAAGARAGIAPENVAVVVNADSPDSRAIAAEYAKLRGIPGCNVVEVAGLADRERMTVDDFRQQVLSPVLRTIADRGLTRQIDVVAYSCDIPTAIDVRGDVGDRRLPQIITPVAAINGLTFLHRQVMDKDIGYLDLEANAYALRPVRERPDTPWTAAEQQRYAELLRRIDDHVKGTQTPPDDADPAAAAAVARELLEGFTTLCESHPRAAHLHYNRACALARLAGADDAVAALAQAVDCGWSDHRHAAGDPDLRGL